MSDLISEKKWTLMAAKACQDVADALEAQAKRRKEAQEFIDESNKWFARIKNKRIRVSK